MRRRQKAQGMTEFALILPLLLLLLLGIIEAARVIWAYITVQQAAREAARYAVTGRPFMNFDTINPDNDPTVDEDEVVNNICTGVSDEPDPYAPATQPWLCEAQQRLLAIERVALDRGHTLNITGGECAGSQDKFFNPTCNGIPGAFGVLVEGQVVTGTAEVTHTLNHPGTQGLNVQVSTFYNVEMITPVYDIVMGGNFLTLRGSAQMQNEGLDAALGIEPPPGIDPINPDSDGTQTGPLTPVIESANGYTFQPSDTINVFLENHPNTQTYDVYLQNSTISQTVKICTDVTTDANGQVTVPCPLAAVEGAPDPGIEYVLYSTIAGQASPPQATAIATVIIFIDTNPSIRFVEGQNVWASGSTTQLELVAHPPTDGPYDVVLFHTDGSLLDTIATGLADSGEFEWANIFDVENDGGKPRCNRRSGTPCIIRSYNGGFTGDPDVNIYAETEVYINQPEIVLQPNAQPYSEGDYIRVVLKDHTPGKSYSIRIPDGPDSEVVILGETLGMNSDGDSPLPVGWRVPASCGGTGAWPDGNYDLSSNEVGGAGAELARITDIAFQTDPTPRLEVNGGLTWPAGSFINIEVHKHTPNVVHYLEFDGDRVPTGNLGDVFNTSECGFATIGFTIPIDTPTGTYPIESFLNDGTWQAEEFIEVGSTPIIRVVQGDKVLPGAHIDIEFVNHRPDTNYKIFYAEKLLMEFQMDGDGEEVRPYELRNLPITPGPDLNDPANYGIFFEMYSQTSETNEIDATTQLAIQGADLRVTKVEFPPASQLKINTTVPVTVTVQNIQTVPIRSYFDVDLYMNPTPIDPSYYKGFNFPGDIKYWQNSVAAAGEPGDSFIITDTVFIDQYGLNELHGFADTSNFIMEGELSNQAANPNNLLSANFTVECNINAAVNTFDAATTRQAFTQSFDFNSTANLSGWTPQLYGTTEFDDDTPKITSSRLELRNDGRSTHGAEDNVSNATGYAFYYWTTPVNSADGLDVVVQVYAAPNNATWAKAGIEIRDSVSSPISPKLDFSLAWNAKSSNRHGLRVAYRDATNPSANTANDPIASDVRLNDGPVWLRVERVAGTNTYNFYYKQQSAQPNANEWGTPYFVKDIKLADQVYVGVLNASHSNNTYRSAEFDNFSYTYYTGNTIPGWATRRFGDADQGTGATISSGQLVLQSDGSSNFLSNDNGVGTTSGGELYFYRTTPFSTTTGFNVFVKISALDLTANSSKGGLEIRSSVESPTSPKVVLGLMRNGTGSNYIVQPGYRSGGNTVWASPGSANISANHQVNLSQPIWLRIERVAGSDTFNYYYRQSATPPPTTLLEFKTWFGLPFANATVSMPNQVYAGLYNAPYANTTTGRSTFDNFGIFDPATCEAPLSTEVEDDLPPGLTLCGDPLVDQSFEQSPSQWKMAFEEGVSRSPSSANSGIYKLAAASHAGFPVNPWFYQGFIMGDWVISSTSTFELALSRNINNLGDNQTGDQFYAVVTTNPSSLAQALANQVTTPTVVAQGVMPSGAYNPSRWDTIKVSLPVIDRASLPSYAGQQLYLYLYNNSNDLNTCGATTCATEFYFDDVSLNPCTTQPLPANIETRIKGEVTLHFSGGSTQKLPYVKVWAYSPGDPTVYETMTLPNGEFNFYNLPPAQYVIFSQYHLIDEIDETQIETLAAQVSVSLTSEHTNNLPQRVFLDLVEALLE